MLTDLIDIQSLSPFWLTGVSPAYGFKDGQRTDEVTGFRYLVVLPKRRFTQLNVRVEGPKVVDAPNGYAEVIFSDLELSVYMRNGQPQIAAKAKSIALANKKA